MNGPQALTGCEFIDKSEIVAAKKIARRRFLRDPKFRLIEFTLETFDANILLLDSVVTAFGSKPKNFMVLNLIWSAPFVVSAERWLWSSLCWRRDKLFVPSLFRFRFLVIKR